MANVIKRMWHISIRIGKGSRLGKMGREALEPRIGKCYKENVAYFSKDWEDPDWGKWAGRHWSPELANVIKRMWHISVRIEKE